MRRHRFLAVLLGILLAGLAACAQQRPTATSPSPSPSPVESSPSPEPSPSESPSEEPSPDAEIPSPPAPPQPPGCAGFKGTNLSRTKVSSLLAGAQKVEEWKGLGQSRVDPKMWPVPRITVPLTMLKAIAYMESGWRTACKARDGIGFGLFQISADTQAAMNQRFGENFDRMTPSGNAALGVAYLEWIMARLGLQHFGTNFDLTKNSKFMDAVIASFQQGPEAVLVNGKIVLNNPDYVTAVRAMMVARPWEH
ncbi:transglycosylase SLT domain-containing protein [Hamadaea tsunoensis]|uniref:transglycosylase SLT domain-containing protein n=1 Tax=Hamadaea tsunoensis TaxID=53368 RepID=UPI0004134C0F|nr:transglycosylase SLT domain-containing protein [Hamadaea tsunoensis]